MEQLDLAGKIRRTTLTLSGNTSLSEERERVAPVSMLRALNGIEDELELVLSCSRRRSVDTFEGRIASLALSAICTVSIQRNYVHRQRSV